MACLPGKVFTKGDTKHIIKLPQLIDGQNKAENEKNGGGYSLRAIKFRAWCVDEWDDDGKTPKTFKMVEWFPQFFSEVSPVTRWSLDFPSDDGRVFLMQYTGLKDMNGVEIYEGDLVVKLCSWDGFWWGDEVAVVVYQSASFVPYDYSYLGWDSDLSIVVGNVYQNPELLDCV